MDNYAFESHLFHCRRRAWGTIYRPVWELTKQYDHRQFVSPTATPSGVLHIQRPELEDGHRDDDTHVSQLVVFNVKRAINDLTWEHQLNSQQVAAVRKWLAIVTTDLSSFELGRVWRRSDPMGASICGGLKHVFAGRATGTLHNRAGPIFRYVAWCNKFGHRPFPLDEPVVYSFMSTGCTEAAPTFLRSFVVAIAFWRRSHYEECSYSGMCERGIPDQEEVVAARSPHY